MTKKLTEEGFIVKAKTIHGDKYDYSLVEYKNCDTNIKLICPIHGIFEQTPYNHLRAKYGCSKCSGNTRSTTDEFIKKAKRIHGSKYDYSLVEYINNEKKVKIICEKHGVFLQTPSSHLSNKGCQKCSGNDTVTTAEFIKMAKEIHGKKYDYSLARYINNHTNVIIICQKHGQFLQSPAKHIIRKQGCPKCNGRNKSVNELIDESKQIHGNKYGYLGIEKNSKTKKIKIMCPIHGEYKQSFFHHINRKQGCPKCSGKNKTTEDFIKEAIKIHGDKYDYSKVNYKNHNTQIIIICLKHGEFLQQPTTHTTMKCGCPICNESRGERAIRSFLINNKLEFISQKKFDDCKNKNKLPFDFYLMDLNICIEYDGLQHFEVSDFFGGEQGFKQTQLNDQIKTDYCLKNNILLIRVRYDEDVDKVLNKKIIEAYNLNIKNS